MNYTKEQIEDFFTNGKRSYPNQNKVHINKRHWEGHYLMIGFEEIQQAANELTHSGLKLYLYLAQNKDDYEFWLSPKDVMSHYKMSESSFNRAKAELIDKGYLVKEGNTYQFFAHSDDSIYTIDQQKEQISKALETYAVIMGTEMAQKKFEKVLKINTEITNRTELQKAFTDFYQELIKEIEEGSKGLYKF